MDPQDKITEQDYSDALRAVEFWACRFTSNLSERDELRSAGNYGVVIAATRFDASKGFKFTTFAQHYVRKYQRESLTWLRSPVSVPIAGALSKYGPQTLAALPIDDFLEILPAIDTAETLDANDRETISAALEKISPQDARLLRQYYFDCLSLREIASLHDLSKEGVRQKIEKAKASLRRALTASQ